MRFREFIKYSKLLIQILTAVVDAKLIEMHGNLVVALFSNQIFTLHDISQEKKDRLEV